MKKLAVVLLVSFGAMSASAANWVLIGSSINNENYHYIDTESISTQGKYMQSYDKIISYADGETAIGLVLYDCKTNPKKSKLTYIATYNLQGKVISSGAVTWNSFEPALPESFSELKANFVCSF